MVREIFINDNKYYRCAECGLIYKDIKLAYKCQEFCAANRGKYICNPEIAKHAELLDEK